MKAIFTLIEYRWGGDLHPSDRGQDVVSSNLEISSWDERTASSWVHHLAEIWFKHEQGKYNFDRFTLLINGVHVDDTYSEDICTFHYIESNDDGSDSKEELEHQAFVKEYWDAVKAVKNRLKAEYDEHVASLQQARVLEAERQWRLAETASEEAARQTYLKLKERFEGK